MDQSGSVRYLLALNLFLYQRLVPSEKSLSPFLWLATVLNRNVCPLQYCRGHLTL